MYDKELDELKKKVDKMLAHKTPEYRQGYNKAVSDFKNALLSWKPQDEEYRGLSDACNEIEKLLKY